MTKRTASTSTKVKKLKKLTRLEEKKDSDFIDSSPEVEHAADVIDIDATTGKVLISSRQDSQSNDLVLAGSHSSLVDQTEPLVVKEMEINLGPALTAPQIPNSRSKTKVVTQNQ